MFYNNVLIGASGGTCETVQILFNPRAGTTIGDMTGGAGLAAAFNGRISASGSGAALASGAGSHYVGKDWGSGVTKTLTGVKTWGVSDSGYESEGGHTFSLHVYGSNSAPSNATDGTKVVEIVNNLTQGNNDQDQTVLSGFTTSTAYRYHWVAVVDRTSSGAAFMVAVEFYGDGPCGFGGYGANAIPDMTSNSAPSGVASAKDEYTASWRAWKAFNRNLTNRWAGATGTPTWLKYDFGSGNEKTIVQYIIRIHSSSNDYPVAWTFEGSNDDSNWTTLDTQSGQYIPPYGVNYYNLNDFTNTTSYRYYRLNVSDFNSDNTFNWVEMMEEAS